MFSTRQLLPLDAESSRPSRLATAATDSASLDVPSNAVTSLVQNDSSSMASHTDLPNDLRSISASNTDAMVGDVIYMSNHAVRALATNSRNSDSTISNLGNNYDSSLEVMPSKSYDTPADDAAMLRLVSANQMPHNYRDNTIDDAEVLVGTLLDAVSEVAASPRILPHPRHA